MSRDAITRQRNVTACIQATSTQQQSEIVAGIVAPGEGVSVSLLEGGRNQ
jgi:hypothetical protein